MASNAAAGVTKDHIKRRGRHSKKKSSKSKGSDMYRKGYVGQGRGK